MLGHKPKLRIYPNLYLLHILIGNCSADGKTSLTEDNIIYISYLHIEKKSTILIIVPVSHCIFSIFRNQNTITHNK